MQEDNRFSNLSAIAYFEKYGLEANATGTDSSRNFSMELVHEIPEIGYRGGIDFEYDGTLEGFKKSLEEIRNNDMYIDSDNDNFKEFLIEQLNNGEDLEDLKSYLEGYLGDRSFMNKLEKAIKDEDKVMDEITVSDSQRWIPLQKQIDAAEAEINEEKEKASHKHDRSEER